MITALLTLFLFPFSSSHPADRETPVYKQTIQDTAQLSRQYEPFLAMSEADLLKLVPPQGGFYFSGSPVTTRGAQENNLGWELSLGDRVKCVYTGTLLPNSDYPENGHIDVRTPTGKTQRFHYYQDPGGKKYWFEARRWFDQRVMMESVAYNMARLYRAGPGQYKEYGRRAALILKRFAEVYPDYIITYDYPGREKVFIDDAAYKKAAENIDYYFIELTKWSWWGYHDLSSSLVLAYDQLRGTEVLSAPDRQLIEGFFDSMIAFTDPYEKVPITNVHPSMWTKKVIAGNVLNKPELLKVAFTGLDRILAEQFTYDGLYMESTVSYHDQTVRGLRSVLTWAFPGLTKEELTEKIRTEYPDLFRAMQGNAAYRLPDGRYAAINDTHWTDRQAEPITRSEPRLMPAAGHAVLGFGTGDRQFQAHLSYPAWHGHNHYGSLGILLFAHGKEMVSDIGYTHTRARAWTMTTAAHNTVVVDGKSQRHYSASPRAGLGDLLLHNTEHPDFQVAEARADEVYPGLTNDYRRTLISVQANTGTCYVVDLFHVTGGKQHDWILHGSADERQTLDVSGPKASGLPFAPLKSMLPAGTPFEVLQEQGQYELIWKDYWAYGHFRQVEAAPASGLVRSAFRYTSNPRLGLQSWIPLGKKHMIYKVQSWSVREADEDQGILDNFLRSGLIIRSEGAKSRFVAVHVPFNGTPGITGVRDLSGEDSLLILRIDHRTGSDYIVYQHKEKRRTVEIAGLKVPLHGQVSLIRKRASGARLLSIEKQEAPLLGFSAGSLIADGTLQAKAGQTAIVRHADGHTTAFLIDSVSRRNGKTTLFTRQPVPFRAGKDKSIKMETFPFLDLKGPHSITVDTAVLTPLSTRSRP